MQKLKDRIIALITIVGITSLGMFGGQKNKGTRRFGVPGIALIAALVTNKVNYRDFTFLLCIPVLIMGYGESSWLFSVCKSDWIVRLVYATLLSIPFMFYGLWKYLFALGLLIAAFQVHAGSLGHISWFGDILVEDILRYGIFGCLVFYNIIKDK